MYGGFMRNFGPMAVFLLVSFLVFGLFAAIIKALGPRK